MITELSTGAALRVMGDGPLAVVCLNGGQGHEVAGTWSATLEWLVQRLAPGLPGLRFGEVRYRIKSWKRLDMCIDDARAAIEQLGGERTLLLGFSMGGAVSIAAADEARVEGVLSLAPWIPDRLDVSTLRGKRLDVIHGALDRGLPGIPGVSPTDLAARVRACPRRRRRGHVHDDPGRRARDRGARARRSHAPAPSRRPLGRARRRRARALRGGLRPRGKPAARVERRRICATVGSFTSQTSPSFSRPRIIHQDTSYCHQARPCRAEDGNAWWLLCQPSPKTRKRDEPVVP